MRNLISYNKTENPFTDRETNVIIQALENLKVLDPACGSGAFPMGILHKLVWILQKVDPENKKWFESIIKRLPNYAQAEMRKKLEGENWDYLRKLGVIQQSVYGVDIQPIAIQIAKLRFFISLLVDQDIKGNADNNFGLMPLPNLDFKLVSANTLIGAPEQNQQNDGKLLFAQDEFFDVFNKLTGQYFGTYEPAEKKKLTNKIEKLVSAKVQEKVDEIQLLGTHTDERFSKHVAEKNKAIIEQKKNDAKLWESYNNLFKHESVGFFETKYFFPEVKEGFDVVIGNPPYLESRHSSFSEELKNIYQLEVKKRWHDLANNITRGADLLIYFFESSLCFINKTGVIVFITQNSWLNSDYGKRFQAFLLKATNVKAIIDSDYKYFDSKEGPNINTVISIFEGNKAYPSNKIIFARYHENFQEIPFSYVESDKLSEYHFAESKEYKYSDENIAAIKWGILLHAEDFVLNLMLVLKEKASYVDKISDGDIKIGQGLNLSKEFIATHEFVRKNSLYHAAIPFVTSDDGAPFVLHSTDNFIIDKNKLTKDENRLLSSYKVKSFDPKSTDKIMPILFLPRGIGRHFCAMNIASAYTASCVDIYDYNNSTSEEVKLNLWLFLNSSVLWLLREISGRKNLGGGMLKAEATDLKSFPLYIQFNKQNEIIKIYEALSKRQAKDTIEEVFSAEHKQIDKLVFDYLGLSLDIRNRTIAYLEKIINERHEKSKS